MINKKFILNLIKKYDIKVSKHFSQNFLHDFLVIKKIIDASDIEKEDVVEIGPGLGSLTSSLLKKANSVTSYEIDKNMHRVLEKEIDEKNFYLKKTNFLDADFNWTKKRVIVANIPYNITTDIIFKIIKKTNKFKSAILMVQKEFGERMIASSGTKHYGKLSVSIQSIANVHELLLVKNKSFIPSPKVNSMVVKIIFKDNYNKEYFDFILKCFAQKRKTLFNNLKIFLEKEKALEILQTFNYSNKIRAQELPIEDFKKIWIYLK